MAKPTFAVYRETIRAGKAPEDARSRGVRLRELRGGRPVEAGKYVLYWMQMYMRGSENAALDEAIRRANELGLSLLVYQGLNSNYPQANARVHTFILECARDVALELAERGISYRFHLRRTRPARGSVLVDLARSAACVVVDDFPAFILPRVTDALVRHTADAGVPVVAVDANGLVPLQAISTRQYAAYTIRPRLHERIAENLVLAPAPVLQNRDTPRLPVSSDSFVALGSLDDAGLAAIVSSCDIDQAVLPSLRHTGGRRAAHTRLARFIEDDLDGYADLRSDPGKAGTSGLSPYMHFGCLSTLEVVRQVLLAEAKDESTDAFLEELVVRRELSYNFCHYTPTEDHASLAALPDWVKKTLSEHAPDERNPTYTAEQLEAARTHDEIWNAAQRELVSTGTFQGYLRMLWGKNIIRWTDTYEQAQEFMIRMHHRYALDGRNPNTYASILWCFGLHDRAFQEQAVLGKLRPLNSSNTGRKFDLEPYFKMVQTAVDERAMPILSDSPSRP